MKKIAGLVVLFVALLLSIGAPAANAKTVTVIETSQSSWRKVWHEELTWSAGGKSAAQVVIDNRTAKLQNTLDDLSHRGAVTVKVLWHSVPQSSVGISRAIPDLHLKAFALIGLDAQGQELARSSQFPSDPKDLGSYLLRPDKTTCSLDGFNLFDFTTWFSAKCGISKTTPEQFLRASLAAKVSFANPNDLALMEVSRLNELAMNHYKFVIRNNKLYCPQLGQPIELVSRAPLGGYRILRVGPAKFRVLLQAPDLKALAKTAKLGVDGNYIQFG